MDRFHQMRTFVTVAEERGFAAAARRLRTSPPAVTRAIAALEADLGVKLFNRTTRSVRMTEAGLRYLEDSRQILADVQRADDAAAGINAEPSGRIAVTAPALFGSKFVMPGIVRYLTAYPNTEIDTVFVDRIVNLVEEGLDVGVRIGQLPDSTLRALPVGKVQRYLVASPAYLHTHGTPVDPGMLKEHSLIASAAGNFSYVWRFGKTGDIAINIKPRLTTTTNDSAIEAALQGFGITSLLSYQVAELISAGELTRILQPFETAALPVNIVHREGRYTSARTRTFIDLLAEHLKSAVLELD